MHWDQHVSHQSLLFMAQQSRCLTVLQHTGKGLWGLGQGLGAGSASHQGPGRGEKALSGAAVLPVPAVQGQEAAGSQLPLNQLPG